MTDGARPEYAIVGRVRNAHGIRGELVVEAITDAPDAVFASGRRLFAGTVTGDLAPGAPALTVQRARPFKGGWIVAFAEIADRTAAELWRERYILARLTELPPPAADEVYYHELVGMRVERPGGDALGEVVGLYELPQGLMLEVRPAGRPTVILPYRPEVVLAVDLARRVLTADPPEGLLDDE
jgi:16S rRNA processing protein RimM